MTINMAATTMVMGLRFISFIRGRCWKLVDQIFADFVFKVENNDVGNIRGGNDVLARIAAVLNHIKIGVLFIDPLVAGGGAVSQLLVGKEHRLGGGIGDG